MNQASIAQTGAAKPLTLPISVVVPAYNRADLLPRALSSVAAQQPAAPAEVIVVDDGSSDNTAVIAERLGATVLRHDRNRGPGAARNTGFAFATQPWLAQLDSDDEWLPSCLATLWELHDGHVLVCGGSLGFGPDGTPLRYNGTMRRLPETLRSGATLAFPDNFIASSGVLVRADVVRAVGGYSSDMRYAEDLDLWIRVLEMGAGIASPAVVTRYFEHPRQATADTAAIHRAHLDVILNLSDRPWWTPALARRWSAIPAWNDLRIALRNLKFLDIADALRRLVRPQTLYGLAIVLRYRQRARSRTRQVIRKSGTAYRSGGS